MWYVHSSICRFASKVYIINRSDKLRASKIMQDRAINNDKIEILWNTARIPRRATPKRSFKKIDRRKGREEKEMKWS